MVRYGMVIDLKRCYGCYGCSMACKTANHTPPEVFWARVLKAESGEFPNTTRQALPVLCMHCENPSCEEVCPTGATSKQDDGIVVVDKDKCIGCKYCMMACPYGARYSVEKWVSYFPDGLELSPYEEFCKTAWEEKSGIGVATKCDFCKDRLAEGREPACVEACAANARTFGDLDDPNSAISRAVNARQSKQQKLASGTKPRFFLLE